MQSVTSATAVATTALANNTTLFASLELSKFKWVVTINGPGSESFPSMWLRWRRRLPARSSFAVEGKGRAALRRADQSDRHSGSGIGRILDSSLAARQWDREPGRRCGFDRGRPAASAGQDRFDRRRDAVAGADGLGPRRAARLFHDSRDEPGRRGSPAPDARARHAALGTHSAYQSDKGPAQRPRHSGLQSASARSFRATRGAANRRRP